MPVIENYDDATLRGLHSYKATSGMPQSQVPEKSCCICSTIRRITLDRRMPAYQSNGRRAAIP